MSILPLPGRQAWRRRKRRSLAKCVLSLSVRWRQGDSGDGHVPFFVSDNGPRAVVREGLARPRGGTPDGWQAFLSAGRVAVTSADSSRPFPPL